MTNNSIGQTTRAIPATQRSCGQIELAPVAGILQEPVKPVVEIVVREAHVLPERRAFPHEPRLDGLPVPGFVSQDLPEHFRRKRRRQANSGGRHSESFGWSAGASQIVAIFTKRGGMVVQALPLHHEPGRGATRCCSTAVDT